MPCFLPPPYSSCCINGRMGKHRTVNIYQIRTGELLCEELMHKTTQQQILLLLLCRCEGWNTKRSNTRKWLARIKNLSCICSVMQTSSWCQFPLENSWNILYIACGQDGNSSFLVWDVSNCLIHGLWWRFTDDKLTHYWPLCVNAYCLVE